MRPHAATCLEINIENAHGQLTRFARTIYITPTRRLVWGQHADAVDKRFEVGTYTKDVPLADFRGDVFDAWDNRGK